MAWCEVCRNHVDPDEVLDGGTCPVCGDVVVEKRKSPWYFKFMLVASVIYLSYRAYQGVEWLSHHVH